MFFRIQGGEIGRIPPNAACPGAFSGQVDQFPMIFAKKVNKLYLKPIFGGVIHP
jgi:hypothetical protein